MKRSTHVDKFKVGDWVRSVGVDPSAPDYDEGEVVALRLCVVGVRWRLAGETYQEDPLGLERIARSKK